MTITAGLAPKAILAFLFPLIAAAAGTLASWVVTGNFSDTEIRTAVSGLITSGLALLGAYVAPPAKTVEGFAGFASDDLLSDEAKAALGADTALPL